MSSLPPPPGNLAPPRWTADANQARLTIPYLGPEPPPSKLSGLAFIGACGGGAVLFLIRAGLYLHLGALEQDFLDHPSQALLSDADSASRLVSSMAPIVLLTVVLTLMFDLIWRFQRRPKQARVERGEAYVEFPLKWVTPMAIRVVWGGLVGAALLANAAGSVNRTTLPTDYPHHRQLLALGNVAWAALWVSIGVWVVLANRSHARRMAFSGPYRTDPSQVPFFPSVAGSVMLDTSESSSGFAWVLRTAGLIIVAVVGLGLVIAGISDLSRARAGGAVQLMLGVGAVGFVIWAGVRRRQRARATG